MKITKLNRGQPTAILIHAICAQQGGQVLTFRQFPFAGCGRLGLLTPDGRPSTADAADDRHGVIITSDLQGVPVRDEGQPAVLSLQGHLKRHESLQIHVTVQVSERQRLQLEPFLRFQDHKHKHMSYGSDLHCSLVLSN